MRKHRYCLFLRKTSTSPFLKDIAQAKSMSLLFPEYILIWEKPEVCQELLLLDTVVNPMVYREDYSWVKFIPKVKVLPGLAKHWEKLLNRKVEEVVL
jgi:hypothetical protein